MITINEQLKDQCISTAKDIETSENLYDYLNNLLELRYIIDSSKNYLGSELLIAYGGPTIRVNTLYNTVVGHWGVDSYTCHYSRPEFQEILEEFYNGIS